MLVLWVTISFNQENTVQKKQKRQNCKPDLHEYFNYCILMFNKKKPRCHENKDQVKHH